MSELSQNRAKRDIDHPIVFCKFRGYRQNYQLAIPKLLINLIPLPSIILSILSYIGVFERDDDDDDVLAIVGLFCSTFCCGILLSLAFTWNLIDVILWVRANKIIVVGE